MKLYLQVSKSELVVVGAETKGKEEGEWVENILLYEEQPLHHFLNGGQHRSN